MASGLTETTTWTSVDLPYVKSSDIHLKAISHEIPQAWITKISFKINHLKCHSNLPGPNELNMVTHQLDRHCPIIVMPVLHQSINVKSGIKHIYIYICITWNKIRMLYTNNVWSICHCLIAWRVCSQSQSLNIIAMYYHIQFILGRPENFCNWPLWDVAITF